MENRNKDLEGSEGDNNSNENVTQPNDEGPSRGDNDGPPPGVDDNDEEPQPGGDDEEGPPPGGDDDDEGPPPGEDDDEGPPPGGFRTVKHYGSTKKVKLGLHNNSGNGNIKYLINNSGANIVLEAYNSGITTNSSIILKILLGSFLFYLI